MKTIDVDKFFCGGALNASDVRLDEPLGEHDPRVHVQTFENGRTRVICGHLLCYKTGENFCEHPAVACLPALDGVGKMECPWVLPPPGNEIVTLHAELKIPKADLERLDYVEKGIFDCLLKNINKDVDTGELVVAAGWAESVEELKQNENWLDANSQRVKDRIDSITEKLQNCISIHFNEEKSRLTAR